MYIHYLVAQAMRKLYWDAKVKFDVLNLKRRIDKRVIEYPVLIKYSHSAD